MEFDFVVEIPKGSRNKYEMGDDGRIHLDRTLYTATVYPTEYGYIDGSLGEDGDPLDGMLLTEVPTFPGCVVLARAIAMFRMTDEKGPDDKALCVPVGDPRFEGLNDVSDVPPFERAHIEHFFQVYKALEPGKFVSDLSWGDRAYAERSIGEAIKRSARA